MLKVLPAQLTIKSSTYMHAHCHHCCFFLPIISYFLNLSVFFFAGDMFNGVGDCVPNDLPYTQNITKHGTDFTHSATGFTGNWEPMSCEVDSIFKVAHIDIEVSGSDSVDTKPLTAGVVTLNMPVMYTGSYFGEFHGESQSASASAVLDAVESSDGGGVFETATSGQEDKEGVSPL